MLDVLRSLHRFIHVTIPITPVLATSLDCLNCSALIDLALKWLQREQYSRQILPATAARPGPMKPLHTCRRYRRPPRSVPPLATRQKDANKRDIIDRIVDGDWRCGLFLHQMAMTDFANLEQNDTALKWSALKIRAT